MKEKKTRAEKKPDGKNPSVKQYVAKLKILQHNNALFAVSFYKIWAYKNKAHATGIYIYNIYIMML